MSNVLGAKRYVRPLAPSPPALVKLAPLAEELTFGERLEYFRPALGLLALALALALIVGVGCFLLARYRRQNVPVTKARAVDRRSLMRAAAGASVQLKK
jgi:hypothetical protein